MNIPSGSAASALAYAAAGPANRQARAAPAATSAGHLAGTDTVTLSAAAQAMLASPTADQSTNPPDVSHMTPNQMQAVATDLWQAGKIDLSQLFMLQTAGVPVGKQGPQGEFVALTAAEQASYGNTPVDYIQVSKDAIAGIEWRHQAADPTSGYTQWKGILATLQFSPQQSVAL